MRVTLWLLRVTFVVHALLAVAQPVLAGAYLGGDFDMLAVHGANAAFVAWLAILAFVAAVAHAIAGGARWPVLVVLGLFVAETVQIVVGYGGALAIHVPLGVTIVATAVVLAAWSIRPSAAVRRSSRRVAVR